MTDLILPRTSPRIAPRSPNEVSPYVLSEFDKTVRTWGIPNNLIRTMACHPGLALTEVDYANSFIFDEGTTIQWPIPGGAGVRSTVPFPTAGFVDRVSKELAINLVSLLNRSRYSITHHSVIGYATLCALLPEDRAEERAKMAEEMLLALADGNAQPTFENRTYASRPLFSELQLRVLRLAVTLRGDAHGVSDADWDALRAELRSDARKRLGPSGFAGDPRTLEPAYLEALVDGALVELTWCILHFAGLLNKWFTVLRVMDETDAARDGVDFVGHYNATIPPRIKERNNAVLGPEGWG